MANMLYNGVPEEEKAPPGLREIPRSVILVGSVLPLGPAEKIARIEESLRAIPAGIPAFIVARFIAADARIDDDAAALAFDDVSVHRIAHHAIWKRIVGVNPINRLDVVFGQAVEHGARGNTASISTTRVILTLPTFQRLILSIITLPVSVRTAAS